MNQAHYEVDAIPNTQIKTQLKNSLHKIKGVRNIEINAEQSTIDVGFNNTASEGQIRDCIETIGCKIESDAF